MCLNKSEAFGDPRNLIEDAFVAVHALGTADVDLFGNDFDGNLTSVFLENGNFTNAVIQANRFTCKRGSLRRESQNGMIPFYHIQLQNVCSTCTNNASFPKIGRDVNLKGNLFENAFRGISLIDAKAIVYNNTFKNIFNKNGAYHASHSGTGIFVENRQTSNGRIFIGGENVHQLNTFSNVNIGLLVINRRKDFEITVAGNSFDNSSFDLQGQASGSNFYNTALSFNYQVNGTKPLDIFIFKNAILNHRIGIHAINYNNIKIGMNASGSFGTGFTNTIRYNLGSSPAPDIHYKAIWLQNCPSAKVVSNEITNDEPATGTDNFRGIDIISSTGCQINCNSIDKLPRSVYFTGDCSRTKLRNNHFWNYENAVELYDGSTIVDEQGDWDPSIPPSGDYRPLNNEWMDDAVISPFSRVFRNGIGQPIYWYHDGAVNHLPTPSNTVNPIPTSNGCNCDCDYFNREINRENSIGRIINDSIEFESYPAENAYQAKMNSYITLKQDSTLIYMGEPDDYVYENFFNEMDNGNMGLFRSVNVAMSDSGNVQDAIAINNAVNDTNNVEYYLKVVNDIYLGKVAQSIELNAADSATLDYISDLEVGLAGNAKFIASAMLGKEVHEPPCSSISRRVIKDQQTAASEINAAEVFPNPARDKIYFLLNISDKVHLNIYDETGRKIFEEQTDKTLFSFDCKTLRQGLYKYRIIQKNNLFLKSGSFTVIH